MKKNITIFLLAVALAVVLVLSLFSLGAPPRQDSVFDSIQHSVANWRNDFSWRVNDWRNDFSWRVDDMREGLGRGFNDWTDDFNWRLRDWSEDFNRRVEDMTTYGLFGIIGRFVGLLSDILSNIGLVVVMVIVFLLSAKLLGGATLAAVLIWFLVSFHHGIRVGTVAGGAVLPLILFAPRLFSVSKAYLSANGVKIPS